MRSCLFILHYFSYFVTTSTVIQKIGNHKYLHSEFLCLCFVCVCMCIYIYLYHKNCKKIFHEGCKLYFYNLIVLTLIKLLRVLKLYTPLYIYIYNFLDQPCILLTLQLKIKRINKRLVTFFPS